MFEQSGRQATEVARQIGVRRIQLYKWQAEFQAEGEEQASPRPRPAASATERSEVESLRREVAQIKEENAMSKKWRHTSRASCRGVRLYPLSTKHA